MLESVRRFFTTWRFAAFVIPLLACLQAFLIAVLVVPARGTALERFAEDFQTWCFGLDPATGKLQPAYVAMFVGDPLALAALIGLVWGRPLRRILRRRPRSVVPHALAACVVAGALVAAFGAASLRGAETLAFPGDGIRTSLRAPAIDLIDQDSKPARLADSRGRVVLITAVYSRCGLACPRILGQARATLAALTPEERADVSVLAVTLDPANDVPEQLARMADAQGIAAPQWRLLTGPVERVERVLDQLGVSRKRDPATGVIDHSNVFVLVDRRGRIAYRFSLGDLQQTWLIEATRGLVHEAAGASEP